MKNKTFNFPILLLLSLVFCLPTLAQDDEEIKNNQLRRITTSGSAEVLVVPSRVVLTFGVETFNPELTAAKRDNDSKASAIIALAKELGVAPKDVQTDYIFVEPVYEGYDERRAGKFLHYLVRKTVVVLLRDTTKFENILTGALERGATHVLRVRFEVDNLKQHRDKARSDAVKAARDKAQALAGELGAKLGRVMSIQDYGSYDPALFYGGSWRERHYGGGQSQVSSQSEAPVSPTVGDALALGQLRISAQINVSFELQ
ncbi:MAG TPA: SIMPL domain-containing protein [Pyrinomonadaceae bacterium]|nr:SIMPL domain-containing protein [Pyrinomonadaceae bacterium]